jgi:plastocyanin
MVYFTPFIAAAVLSHLASAVPVPDSAIGPEVAVSAPNGVIESDTVTLATATALNNYGSNQNNYGSSNNYGGSNNYNMGSNYDNNNNYNTDTYDSYTTSTDYNNNYYNTDTYDSYSTSTYDNNYYNTDTYDSYSTSTYDNSYNTDTYDSYSTSTYYDDNSYNTDTYDSYSTSTYSAYNTYSTSTTAYYTTSTYDTYSALATSTYSASYGSGSSSWGNSGYDNCVQQCMASYAPPLATYTPSPSSSNQDDSAGSAGTNGVTHTVIVAPTQGVLRYVPFAVNASVGDTIQFMWGANNHTVTKSSELLPCNKTADTPFASGEQNQGFTFNQVVNDTNPTFFYCGTPGHCEKGMFGIINPPSAYSSSNSVGNALPSMSSNNSDIAAMASYTSAYTNNNSYAATWGSSIDMSSLPSWSWNYVAENTMYTRTFLAANPDVITSSGVNLGAAGSNPLMIPQDITVALSNDANSTDTSSTSAPSSTAATSGGSAPSPSASSNGASSLASPRILIAAMAVVATFFAL